MEKNELLKVYETERSEFTLRATSVTTKNGKTFLSYEINLFGKRARVKTSADNALLLPKKAGMYRIKCTLQEDKRSFYPEYWLNDIEILSNDNESKVETGEIPF